MNDFWNDDDIQPHSRKRSRARSWVLRIAAGATLLGFVGLLAAGAWSLLGGKETTKRQVVQISLLKPPPPPPPPPPPEVKPPEPEVKEEVKLPEPEPQPKADEAPPPGEQLGLDADANGSADGFGLAARKGGQDITTLGGGGGNRAQLAWFTGMVESVLQEQFQKNDKLRRADYRAVVKVWFARNGALERFELAGSSGNPEIDRNLQLALSEMPRLKQPPPEDLPQPVKLRITSRGSS
jgi:periplasmic protein TonB